MKTDSTDALRQAQDRVTKQAVELEKLVAERAGRLPVSIAELQAYSFKNGDASFLCGQPPTPKAD